MPITIDGTNGITQAGEFNSDSTFGFKNRIINGAMGIWQRGTPVTTSGGYTADRWTQVSGNSIVHTQSTDAPTGFTNSMQMAGTGSNIAQRIESVNCIGLGGASVTVSLWYKNSSGSDSLSLALYYCNTTDSFGSVTQIGSNQTLAASPSSSWTYYTATFTNISANAINGLALYIFRGSSATATGLLTGVQLEVGSTATSFDYRPYGTELGLCQRYYFQISNDASYTNATFGTGVSGGGTNLFNCSTTLPVTMRTVPSISASTASQFSQGIPYVGVASLTAGPTINTGNSSPYIAQYYWSTNSLGTAGQAALLQSNTATYTYLGFSAEL
jgi:hypothetical protein